MEQEEASRPSIQSEELFRLIAENVSDFAIFAIELDGRAASWNPGVEKLLGYTEEEWIGRDACDIFTPEDMAQDACARELRTAREKDRAEDQRWHLRKDGTRFWGNGLMMALRDEAGALRGFAKVMRDDTARKQAEDNLRESEGLYRLVARATSDAVWDWNLITNEVEWNEGVSTLFGYRREEVGREATWWYEHIHPEDRDRVVAGIHAVIDAGGERWSDEYRYLKSDGTYALVLDRGYCLRGEQGKTVRMVGGMQDVAGRREAEEALAAARARLDLVLDSSELGLWYCDLPFNELNWSERTKEHFWLPFDARVTIETFYERLHPDDRERTKRAIESSIETRTGYDIEYRTIHPEGGEAKWIRAIGRGFYDEQNQPYRFDGITIDITERRRMEEALRESEARFRNMADNAPVMVWVTDADASCTYLSQSWYTFTGQTPETGLGFGWLDTVHPEDREPSGKVFLDAHERHEAFRLDYRLRGADGEYRWAIDSAVPRFGAGGEFLGYIGSVIDIHDRKRAEEENARLLVEAQESNRLKDEFLATLSHELRTPLTAILGWSRLLQANNFDEAATARALETIQRNAQAQVQLIDDLLDVSRIITSKLRLDVRAVDLLSVVTTAADTARPAAEAKNIRLQMLLDPQAGPISGDPDRLQQVVWNLISNAVKFTPKGGRVQVRLERVNSHVEITVSDTGKGIAPEFLPHVFDRFRQADQTTTRTHGGLGLGLAIVRQLVELHGGTVHAESRGEGQGATFTVSLPLLPVRTKPAGDVPRAHPAERSGAALDCPPQLGRLRVLVVDDEEDTRELLGAVLGQCGSEVTTAASALEAIEQLERLKPDILVSDIGMPGEDGYELIRKVRALEAARGGGRIPAIALTAYARVEDRVRALNAGFQVHVPKPIEPVELVAVIASLAGRTGAS